MDRESRPTSLVPDDKKFNKSFDGILEIKPKVKKKLEHDVMFYESDDSMNVTVVETPKHDGSDSGVEMNVKCHHCLDMEGDGTFTTSCNSSIISEHSSSPCCGDDDLATSTSNLQISGELNDFLSPSCDGTSENGSESSSVGSSKVCRPNCINLKRSCLFGKPLYRSSSVNGRRTASPNNLEKDKLVQRTSPILKHDTCRKNSSMQNNGGTPRMRNTEIRSKTVRSLSSSRGRSQNVSEDKKWPLDGRISLKSKPPSSHNNTVNNNNNNNSDSDKSNSLYATLPRHNKSRDNNGRNDGRSPASREPSLNRAASLRKKFVDNNLMTTSLTVPSGTSPVISKTNPTNTNHCKPQKTKIYHEISIQTSLTNGDLNQIIAGVPTKSMTNSIQMEDFAQQINNDHEVDKIGSINEELKKLKSDNMKQRNVIEWLEGELASNKEDKIKFQNQIVGATERINTLLNHEKPYTVEDSLDQLEKEINIKNEVITKQQEEINEFQDMCCILKKDLDKSFSTQRLLIESQKTTELESLELQEFMQVEKSLLNDSLKDLETELNCYEEQIIKLQEDLNNKTDQCSHLVRISEQQRQENLLLHVRLSNLEHRSKELLLQQGAAISSASVALSGLTTRFDLLLEQLTNAYNINDTDLEDGIYYNDAYSCSSGSGEEMNDVVQDSHVETKITETENYPSSRKSFMFALLNAIRNAATQSSILKQTIAQTSTNQIFEKKVALSALPSTSTKTTSLEECKGYDDSRQSSSNNDSSLSDNKLSKSILTINDDLTDLTKSNKRNSLPVTFADDLEDNSCKMEYNISESLNNLSDAILTRQIIEGFGEDDLLKEYLKQDISLVDQVIEIDNTVTRLLKAIRIIQISFNLEEYGNNYWDCKDLSQNSTQLLHKRNFPILQECNQSEIHSDESSPLDVNTSPADLLFKVQHQRSVICRVLKMLRNMRDSMNDSPDLQKIHDELESVNYTSCSELPISPQDIA